MRQRILAGAAFVVGLASLPPAQSTYDGFGGTQLDRNKWTTEGDPNALAVSGGLLRFNAARQTSRVSIIATSGLRNDFDLIVKFQGFSTTQNDTGLYLGAGGGEVELLVGLVRTGSGLQFTGQLNEGSRTTHQANAPTSATAGELRLSRRGTTLQAAYREAGQSNWSVLGGSQPWTTNKLGGSVTFLVEASSNGAGSIQAQCDAVTYQGQLVGGGIAYYGTRCANLDMLAIGFPHVGNREFDLLAFAPLSYPRGAAGVITFGAQRRAIDLGAIGAPGCSIYHDQLLLLNARFVSSQNKREWEFALDIPNDPGLIGGKLLGQYAVLAPVNALGIAWSNAVEVTILR